MPWKQAILLVPRGVFMERRADQTALAIPRGWLSKPRALGKETASQSRVMQPVPVVGGEGVRLLRLGGSTRLGVTSSTHPGMPSPEWVPSPYEYFLPSSYCVPSTDRPGLAGTGLSKRNKTSVVTELTLESGRQTLTHMCKIQRLLAGHRCYGEKEVRKGVQRT